MNKYSFEPELCFGHFLAIAVKADEATIRQQNKINVI